MQEVGTTRDLLCNAEGVAGVNNVSPPLPRRGVRCYWTGVFEVEASPRQFAVRDTVDRLEEVIAVLIHVVCLGMAGLGSFLRSEDPEQLVDFVL